MSRNRQTRSISRRLLVTSLLAFLIAALVGISTRRTAAQTTNEVTVSAAISLKDSLDEIGKLYEKAHPGAKISFNYAGSGTLQRQIEQGAPVDIFFSAAEKQMDDLQTKGLIDAGTRRDIVRNQLVLIVPASNTTTHTFEELSSPSVKVVALGEPSTVPAGSYARQSLERLGLWGSVDGREKSGLRQRCARGTDLRRNWKRRCGDGVPDRRAGLAEGAHRCGGACRFPRPDHLSGRDFEGRKKFACRCAFSRVSFKQRSPRSIRQVRLSARRKSSRKELIQVQFPRDGMVSSVDLAGDKRHRHDLHVRPRAGCGCLA